MKRRNFLGSLAGSLGGSAFLAVSPERVAAQISGGLDNSLPPGSLGEPIAIGLNAQIPFSRNARQLARSRDGRWFIVYACHPSRSADGAYRPATDIWIRSSKTAAPQTMADFEPEHLLIRDAKGGYAGPTPTPQIGGYIIDGEGPAHAGIAPSIVIDPNDVLHLVWQRQDTPEIWYARCEISKEFRGKALSSTSQWFHADARTPGAECIAPKGALLGDLCLDRRGQLCVIYQNEAGVMLAHSGNDEWRNTILAKGRHARMPAITADPAGVLHVAFVAAQGVSGGLLYYLRSDDDGAHWTGSGGGATPDLIGGYCRELPALAVSGNDVLVVHAQGVNVINFTHYDGHKWSGNTVVPKSYNHGSPTLSLDCHGIIWLQMAHKQFDWTLTCRWLGDGWSDVQEGRHLLDFAHAATAERQSPADARSFGILLADSSHRLFFDTMAVPVPAAVKGAHVMFLDLWEVASLRGVSQVVEPLEKDTHNPLIKGGREGEWDWGQVDFQGTILKEGDRYRMWYTGMDKTPLTDADLKSACGYAESADGVHWTKPDLGLYSWNGSKHNNICLPFGYHFNVLKMPQSVEPDPARRYRMVTTARNVLLAFSSDGIHWTLSPDNPLWRSREDTRCLYCGLDNVTYIYDAQDPNPRRRYKAYPQANPGNKMRVSALMVSADGIHFREYPNNPILDADLGAEKQNHLIELCWQRHGLFIGLYGCFLEDVNVDARLAVSRDGVHWVRVKDEVVMLPTGPKGSWEGAMVYPSNYPIIEGDNIWIYYAGLEENFSAGEGHACVGRARVRLDGFAKMQLRPGTTAGSITTVPFQLRDTDHPALVVNADRLAPAKRWITVEVLDAATGAALPGYSSEDCKALDRDGIAIPVTWRQKASLDGIRHEKIRFRFIFSAVEGSPRLCAFGFQ